MAYKPRFTITPLLVSRIEEISALRERILAATIDVLWIPAMQKESRVRNAHSSTAIEGNPLTLEEVRAIEEGRILPGTSDRSRREIINYFAGVRYIEKHIDKVYLTHKDILKLHKIIAGEVMDQGNAGQYRTFHVRVGSYLPPPPVKVRELMSEFLVWWNEDSKELSPVISSAILHYQFEAIHPFADGNGRAGRMIALWELYRRGFDTHHIFSIDEFFWEKRPRYYKALQSVREQKDDLTDWLEYAAEGIFVTLDRVWKRIEQFLSQAKAGGKKLLLRPKQEILLRMLREQGSMSPSEIWKALGVSKQGAIDILRPLVEAGLVERIGTRKSGKYILR